jgi:hypothetical protein
MNRSAGPTTIITHPITTWYSSQQSNKNKTYSRNEDTTTTPTHQQQHQQTTTTTTTTLALPTWSKELPVLYCTECDNVNSISGLL